MLSLRRLVPPIALAAIFLLNACDRSGSAPSISVPVKSVHYTYEIVHTYPHDREAFTQGLLFLNGVLYESTGLNGQSSVRKVDLTTGKVLQRIEVSKQYFAEGLAELKGKLYQLTWLNGAAFRYDLNTFETEAQFSYTGEGWGLTTDGKQLIMSDGTDSVRFLAPGDFSVVRSIHVVNNGQPVVKLNELEYIKGEIYANIWTTDEVVRIDPASGQVLGTIDFSGLLPAADRDADTDVLNGIAYDPATDRLFITGKRWPKLFEVRLKPKAE